MECHNRERIFNSDTRLDENTPTVSLQGEPVITLLTSDKWIDPGATWTDPEDGSGTVFAQNDFNQTHPTFEEWIQNGKQLPEDMMFIGGTPGSMNLPEKP